MSHSKQEVGVLTSKECYPLLGVVYLLSGPYVQFSSKQNVACSLVRKAHHQLLARCSCWGTGKLPLGLFWVSSHPCWPPPPPPPPLPQPAEPPRRGTAVGTTGYISIGKLHTLCSSSIFGCSVQTKSELITRWCDEKLVLQKQTIGACHSWIKLFQSCPRTRPWLRFLGAFASSIVRNSTSTPYSLLPPNTPPSI